MSFLGFFFKFPRCTKRLQGGDLGWSRFGWRQLQRGFRLQRHGAGTAHRWNGRGLCRADGGWGPDDLGSFEAFFESMKKHTIPKFNMVHLKMAPWRFRRFLLETIIFSGSMLNSGSVPVSRLVKVNQATPPYVATCYLTYLPGYLPFQEKAGRPYMILWKPIGFP